MNPFPFQVVDPRLSAGRGEEFSASRLREKAEELAHEDGFHMPMNQRIEDSLDSDGLQVASVHTAIAEDNKGFQMLQRMGWKGQGLGSKEDGIVEPVKGGAEPGLRLGVGKQEQDDFYTTADNVQRRRLEVEIQADEDESRTAKREMQAERDQRIKQDVSAIKRTFYCEVCHKQYASAAEMETHLSSYDHHHKKRLIEMRASEYERTRKERDRKEKRRLEKETARLNEQIQKAHGARVTPAGASAAPSFMPDAAPPPPLPEGNPPLPPSEGAPPPPPPSDDFAPPPPPPEAPAAGPLGQGGSNIPAERLNTGSRGAIQFNMGGPPKKVGLGVKQPHLKKKVGIVKPHVAAFAMDSDEES